MADTERIYRVALFGVVGTGKSSIINLLAGRQVADISTSVEPCTRRARWYPISLRGKNFRLWDTMGFNPAETKDVHPLSPYEQAYSLLRNLRDGVDIILLCARADLVGTSLRKLHWLLDSFFFGGRAQIALVLTHFDSIPEDRRSGWWDRNMNDITQKSGIDLRFKPYACISTVYDEHPELDILYQQSKDALEALLCDVDGAPTPLPSSPLLGDANDVEDLKTYCQLNHTDAMALVERFRSPMRPNVVLFGEAGVGKSSVINLLGGQPKAEVSSNLDSCTLEFKKHEVNTGSHRFEVWDTVGYNGRCSGRSMRWMAIENAIRLIRNLHDQGGIDLLIFCKRSGRLQDSETDWFKLFYEVLCENQVPVAIIITHLESENRPMEDWWERNEKGILEGLELQPRNLAGHVCITSQEESSDQKLNEKLTQSREHVRAMLEKSISDSNAFTRDVESWVMTFLRKLVKIVKTGNPSKKEKITAKSLMERYGLKKEHAEELVRLLSAS